MKKQTDLKKSKQTKVTVQSKDKKSPVVSSKDKKVENKKDILAIQPLQVGSKVPSFKALNQEGKEVSSDDFKGKKMLIYFYPKDDTPTCTKEACNLRDNHHHLMKKGYTVIGISADTAKAHDKFVKKYQLPFDLLADTEKEIVKKFGVYGPKHFMGRVSDSIHRITFIVNEKGIIEKVINKVEAANHYEQIISKSE